MNSIIHLPPTIPSYWLSNLSSFQLSVLSQLFTEIVGIAFPAFENCCLVAGWGLLKFIYSIYFHYWCRLSLGNATWTWQDSFQKYMTPVNTCLRAYRKTWTYAATSKCLCQKRFCKICQKRAHSTLNISCTPWTTWQCVEIISLSYCVCLVEFTQINGCLRYLNPVMNALWSIIWTVVWVLIIRLLSVCSWLASLWYCSQNNHCYFLHDTIALTFKVVAG